MIRYVIRRLLWACVLFVAVTLVTYVIFFLIPVDPARLIAGKAARPVDIERVRHHFHLDRPVYEQYWFFLKRLVWQHSLGFSFANRQQINDVVLKAAPVSFSLIVGGAVLWMLIALPIGVLSALRPRSLLDRGSMVFVLIGISAHPVWIGLILAYVIGFKLGLTPITGYCNFFGSETGCAGPWPWFYHLILPWMTFAFLFAALYVRMIRANVMETLNEDYVRTARAKGAPELVVLRSHVLRNAMLTVVTMLGMDISYAVGNTIFTESIFGLPGLGRTALQGLENFDLPTTQGVVVFATFAIIVLNLIVDLLYAWIDPRIRLA